MALLANYLRLLFPHAYLNRGVPFWRWRWVMIPPERSAWLFTWRLEAGLVWMIVFMGWIWVASQFPPGAFPMGSKFSAIALMVWIAYGVVIVLAVAKASPNAVFRIRFFRRRRSRPDE